MPITDSPLPDADEPGQWVVLWKALDDGRIHVWVTDSGDQAIADNEPEALRMLADAKRCIDKAGRASGRGRLAASGLWLSWSPGNEL